MIVIVAGFILLSTLSIVLAMEPYVGKKPVAWKEYCAEQRVKKIQESMDR